MRHENIYNRLKRIEGQVRGVQEMLAKDRADKDILIQLEAIHSSIASSISVLLAGLFDIQEDGTLKITQEEAETILRLIKK